MGTGASWEDMGADVRGIDDYHSFLLSTKDCILQDRN